MGIRKPQTSLGLDYFSVVVDFRRSGWSNVDDLSRRSKWRKTTRDFNTGILY